MLVPFRAQVGILPAHLDRRIDAEERLERFSWGHGGEAGLGDEAVVEEDGDVFALQEQVVGIVRSLRGARAAPADPKGTHGRGNGRKAFIKTRGEGGGRGRPGRKRVHRRTYFLSQNRAISLKTQKASTHLYSRCAIFASYSRAKTNLSMIHSEGEGRRNV